MVNTDGKPVKYGIERIYLDQPYPIPSSCVYLEERVGV
jgi:hypothetical protein